MKNADQFAPCPLHGRILACALAGGLLAVILVYPSLFCGVNPGLNAPALFVGAYVCLFAFLGRRMFPASSMGWVYLLIALANAASFALFNNGLLRFLNFCSVLFCTASQLLLAFGWRLDAPGVLSALFIRPFHRIGRFYRETFTRPSEGGRNTLRQVLLGVIISLPMLILLVLLLSASDLVFSGMLQGIFQISSIWTLLGWTFVFSVGFSLVGSLLLSLLTEPLESAPAPNAFLDAPATQGRPAGVRVRPTPNLLPIHILLSLVSLLLLVFSGIQLLYLTGLRTLPYGLNYSDYARSGFFELCFAAAAVFGIIALTMHLARRAERKRLLRVLHTLLCVLTIVLLVSAFYRMALYEQAFSYTRLRLYVQGFMVLLGAVCVLTLCKIWRDRFRIVRAALFAVLIALVGLTYFNVDAFIARENVAAYAEGRAEALDVDYLLSLSVDALPYYADALTVEYFCDPAYPLIAGENWSDEEYWSNLDRARLRRYRLMLHIETLGQSDWRAWNAGRQACGQFLPALKNIVEQVTPQDAEIL